MTSYTTLPEEEQPLRPSTPRTPNRQPPTEGRFTELDALDDSVSWCSVVYKALLFPRPLFFLRRPFPAHLLNLGSRGEFAETWFTHEGVSATYPDI